MNLSIEQILAVVGAVSSLLTVLGSTLPKEWAFTRFAAKFGADLKGVHAPKDEQ